MSTVARPSGTAGGNWGAGVVAPAGRGTAWEWRRWRGPVALVAVILLSGVVIALLQAGPTASADLDPRNAGPAGTRALAALLAHQGRPVTTVVTAAAAVTHAQDASTTLVVTRPQLLGSASLAALARVPASLLVVAPTPRVLSRLAPAVTLAGTAPVTSEPPLCALTAARLAGPADMGGLLLRSSAPGTWRCYPAERAPTTGQRAPTTGQTATGQTATGQTATGHVGNVTQAASDIAGLVPASLVRYVSGGRTVTVLGTGAPLTNQNLGTGGNAALALNLLDAGSRVVWLVPTARPAAAGSGRGQRPLTSLIPEPAYLVALQIAIAVMAAAAWRMRRFGPLVAEPLPVVVRASETVEGHGRLYRSRRARGQAANVLRSAALARIGARLPLPPGSPPAQTCQELAARTGRDPGEIEAIMFGPQPRDEAALVALAASLDSLEGQVLSQ